MLCYGTIKRRPSNQIEFGALIGVWRKVRVSITMLLYMFCWLLTFSGMSHGNLDGGRKLNSGSPLQWPSSLYLKIKLQTMADGFLV